MFIANAYAQTAAAAPSGLASIFASPLVPILLMVAVFYVLVFMPQQKEQKKLKTRLSALKRGDKVVTAGGILGTVKKTVDGSDNIDVEIAPNVVVSVVRTTITTVLDAPAPANDKT
jgi:preprotein translocase subunit YajC